MAKILFLKLRFSTTAISIQVRSRVNYSGKKRGISPSLLLCSVRSNFGMIVIGAQLGEGTLRGTRILRAEG